MYNVPESESFTAKYRAVLRGEEIKLFTPNDSISLYSQVNFDNQSLQKSAVDYFAVSISVYVKKKSSCQIVDLKKIKI